VGGGEAGDEAGDRGIRGSMRRSAYSWDLQGLRESTS